MILAALIDEYILYLKNHQKASKQTVKNYQHYLSRFLNFSGPIKAQDINLSLIKKYKLYLENFVEPIHDKPLKTVTQNYFLIALRAFLDYLNQKGLVAIDSKSVILKIQQTQKVKVLDQQSLEKLLHSPDTSKTSGIRDKTILEVLISTGLRVSELASLNRTSINFLEKKIEVLGKNQKKRTVFLSDSAVVWLTRYLQTRKDSFKPLFIRYQGKANLKEDGAKMRLTPRSLERVVEKYVKQLNLSIKATPHTLRHTLAKNLLSRGNNAFFVKQTLGYSHISSTQMYKHPET